MRPRLGVERAWRDGRRRLVPRGRRRSTITDLRSGCSSEGQCQAQPVVDRLHQRGGKWADVLDESAAVDHQCL